jgi:hypothetical protein
VNNNVSNPSYAQAVTVSNNSVSPSEQNKVVQDQYDYYRNQGSASYPVYNNNTNTSNVNNTNNVNTSTVESHEEKKESKCAIM